MGPGGLWESRAVSLQSSIKGGREAKKENSGDLQGSLLSVHLSADQHMHIRKTI